MPIMINPLAFLIGMFENLSKERLDNILKIELTYLGNGYEIQVRIRRDDNIVSKNFFSWT